MNTFSGIGSWLYGISLDTNKLTITIPNFFDNIPNFYYFNVGLDRLSADITFSFNFYPRSNLLYVYANILHDKILFDFGTFPSLEVFSAWNNHFWQHHPIQFG